MNKENPKIQGQKKTLANPKVKDQHQNQNQKQYPNQNRMKRRNPRVKQLIKEKPLQLRQQKLRSLVWKYFVDASPGIATTDFVLCMF